MTLFGIRKFFRFVFRILLFGHFPNFFRKSTNFSWNHKFLSQIHIETEINITTRIENHIETTRHIIIVVVVFTTWNCLSSAPASAFVFLRPPVLPLRPPRSPLLGRFRPSIIWWCTEKKKINEKITRKNNETYVARCLQQRIDRFAQNVVKLGQIEAVDGTIDAHRHFRLS